MSIILENKEELLSNIPLFLNYTYPLEVKELEESKTSKQLGYFWQIMNHLAVWYRQEGYQYYTPELCCHDLYDEAGLYHRAPFMILFYLFGCHYVLGGLIVLYRRRRRLQRRMVNIMVSYILLIIFGMIIQAAFPKMLTEGFFSTISLLLTYITIQSPSEMIDEEVEVLNRRAFLASASMQMDRKIFRIRPIA